MGTWAIPETENDKLKAESAIFLLEAFKKLIYPIVGDDELFDNLDSAIMRIKVLAKIDQSVK